MLLFSSGAARGAPGGDSLLLTILEFAGSAVVGVFYVTILVALATRKRTRAAPAGQDETARRLDPAS
jgi:hypothetical protein